MENLKVYTEEQADRLTQFKRANDILQILDSRREDLTIGYNVQIQVIKETEIMLFDAEMAGMVRGAVYGLYNESVDMGLKEEVEHVVFETRK